MVGCCWERALNAFFGPRESTAAMLQPFLALAKMLVSYWPLARFA
jgi:hypothetical protein